MFKKLLALLALVTLTACSSTGMSVSETNKAYQAYVTNNEIPALDKIRSFKYSGWQSLSYDYLIISTRVSDKYLIELTGYCTDLMFTNSIVINQRNRSTLMSKFDSIRVISNPKIECQIKAIYPLTKTQVSDISAIGKETKKDVN